MIDHAAVNVSDFEAAKSFYSAALEPLRYSVALATDEFAGFADATGFSFAVFRRDPVGGAHIAFKCDTRALVDGFHGAALAAGATDNGSPGLRPHYHENYYGASSAMRTATTSRRSARRLPDQPSFRSCPGSR